MANDEYMTPIKYVKLIRQVLDPIHIDPFSSKLANSRIGALNFYTKEDNGFRFPWHGNIYANPPYSRGNLQKFSTYVWDQYAIYRQMKQMIGLVPNSTSEKWFQCLIKITGSAICFPDHRIKFTTYENGRFVENSSPEDGNAFIYLGENRHSFAEVFSTIGTIVCRF